MTVAVGLAGFGSVGQAVGLRLTSGALPGMRLTAVSARDLTRAAENARKLTPAPEVVRLEALPRHADIIVECATAEAFPEIARTVLRAGKTLIAVSVGGLPDCPEAESLALEHGGRLHVASGALPGLDIVRGLKEGGIRRIKLTSRIRPQSLAKEPYVLAQGFDFARPPENPVRVFLGSAREAAAAFPRHFNVAIALSLGGIGFDRTEVEVIADSSIPGPVHHIEAEGDDADLTLVSRNRASSNPRTARLVAPSIVAALRSYVAPIRVGT
jgi:aspartate dehydrogenase